MCKGTNNLTKLHLLNLQEDLLSGCTFHIPSYQRGYRWQTTMIKRLLDDIVECKESMYCIQPIVVKKKDDKTYIVADGQQRLTTLYIVYSALGVELPFTFKYETRDEVTGEYLRNKLFERNMETKSVDAHFIANAYKTVSEYKDKDILKNKLELVHFIWYPLSDDTNDQSYFDRLNFGKIKLTDAELVKALFLLDVQSEKINDKGQNLQDQIALEWDLMERQLQDNKFWYFLDDSFNRNKNVYSVRIELVLDLYTQHYAKKNREEYSTFLDIEKQVEGNVSIMSIWENINKIYSILCEWYEDDWMFHYIGYLTSLRSRSSNLLDNLLDKWNSCSSKEEFKNSLIDKISKILNNRIVSANPIHIADTDFLRHYRNHILKKSLSEEELKNLFVDNYNLSGLSYNNNNDKYLIQDVLLLFNILEMKPTDEKEENWRSRFRFDLYKQKNKKKQVWSLEHIHSQNKSIKEDEDVLHTIDNMALLTVGDNASNSDDSYQMKKDNIRSLDIKGSFIPQATKNVFLKYYTLSDNEDNDLQEWTEKDRKDYFLHMVYTLNLFIK